MSIRRLAVLTHSLTTCTRVSGVVRNVHSTTVRSVEVPNFMSFLSNTESEKAERVSEEVSKKQVLADDDDEEDMEQMFIMVSE
jgi:hypothetical protein